jgi:hypothetical protein
MKKALSPSGSKPFPWLIALLGLLVLGAAAAVGWNWYQTMRTGLGCWGGNLNLGAERGA